MVDIISEAGEGEIIESANIWRSVEKELGEVANARQSSDAPVASAVEEVIVRHKRGRAMAERAAELLETYPRVPLTPGWGKKPETHRVLERKAEQMKKEAVRLDAIASVTEVEVFYGVGEVPLKLVTDKFDLVPFGSGVLMMGGAGKKFPLAGFADLGEAISATLGNVLSTRGTEHG